MPSHSQLRERLEEINSILQSGVQSTTNDNGTATFNHDTLRQERSRIEQQLNQRSKRSVVNNWNFNGR